jgi:hypothetical protein
MCDAPPFPIVEEGFNEGGTVMTSVLITASALEVGLVIIAGIIFLAMVVSALAVIIWSVAGVIQAAHGDVPHTSA